MTEDALSELSLGSVNLRGCAFYYKIAFSQSSNVHSAASRYLDYKEKSIIQGICLLSKEWRREARQYVNTGHPAEPYYSTF